MYQTDMNGSKLPVTFKMSPDSVVFTATPPADTSNSQEKEAGSNKGMLFVALGITALVVGASAYLLYRYHKKQKDSSFGYRLV